MHEQVAQVTGADPLPYGIEQNRPMIDQLLRYAADQHIIDKPATAEELFHPSTHSLTA
jgi:4,5-dihydroxyphthalate decarboxylase